MMNHQYQLALPCSTLAQCVVYANSDFGICEFHETLVCSRIRLEKSKNLNSEVNRFTHLDHSGMYWDTI